MSESETIELLERVTAALGEHFEAVQILVSWNEDGMTKALHRGAGNWYARQGMAHEFINKDVAQEHAVRLAEVMPQPPDDWE